MVDFVEQAVLQVQDKSTKPTRAITNEIKKLIRTAKGLEKLKINVTGLTQTQAKAEKLRDTIGRLPRSKTIRINVNAESTRALSNRIAALRKTKPIVIPFQFPGLRGGITDTGKLIKQLNKLRQMKDISILVKTDVKDPTTSGGKDSSPSAVPTFDANKHFSSLNRLMRDSMSRLGYTIESAIIRGFAESTVRRDVAETSLNLLNLTPEARAEAEKSITRINESTPTFNEGQIRGVMAEVLRTTRFDQQGADALTMEAVKLAELQVALGEDAKRAIESAFQFVKVAEQTGQITDTEGAFDPKRADAFFNTLKKNIIAGGQEIDARLVRTLTKSLRVGRFGLDERGFTTAIALAEEQGSTAGVGINQAIKQLSGQGQEKYRLRFMEELGLLEIKEVVTGSVGGRKVKETRADNPIDNEFLRRDPAGWVRKHLLPRLEERGIDINNPAQVGKIANDIVGDRSAVETLTALILRSEELQRHGDLAQGLNVSDEFIAQAASDSLVTALANAEAGLTDAMGATAESLETVMIPALNKIGTVADSLAAFIEGPDGEGSAGRTAAVVGGAAVTAGAAAGGLKALLNGAGLTKAGNRLHTAGDKLILAADKMGAGDTGGKSKSKSKTRKPTISQGGKAGAALAAGGLLASFLPEEIVGKKIAGITDEIAEFLSSPTELLNFFPGMGANLSITNDPDFQKEFKKFYAEESAANAQRQLFAEKREQRAQAIAAEDERKRKVDHLIGLMERNTARIFEPGRSDASMQDLQRQQLGNFNDFAGQANAWDLLPLVGLEEFTSEVEQAFGGGAAEVKKETADAAAAFGPAAAQGLLAAAPQIGQMLGSAAAKELGRLVLRTPSRAELPAPAIDTGTSAPF